MHQSRRSFAAISQPIPALAPALDPGVPITPELDAQLGRLARRAADGDCRALDTLFTAFGPRLRPAITRCQRQLSWRMADRALEPADIAQEAFVVFAELVAAWSGQGSLSAYLIGYFRWRLRDRVRQLADRPHADLSLASGLPLHDGSHAADEAVALLEELAAGLGERASRVLLLRVRDERSWNEIARQLGVTRRTVLRDWRRIKTDLSARMIAEP